MDHVRADQRLPLGPEGDGSSRRAHEESDDEHELFEEPMSFEQAEVLRRQKTVIVPFESETNQRNVILPGDNESPRRNVDELDEDTELCEDPWSFERIEALQRQRKETVVSPRVKVDRAVLFTAEGYGSRRKDDDEDDSRAASSLPVERIETLQRQQRVLGLASPRAEVNNGTFFSLEINQSFAKSEDKSDGKDELREAPLSVKQVEALNRSREIFEPSEVEVHQRAFVAFKSDDTPQQTNDASDDEDDLCEAPLNVEQIAAMKRQQRAARPLSNESHEKTNVESKTDESPGPDDEGSDEDDNLCEAPLSFEQIEALKRQQKPAVLPRVEIDSETIFLPKYIEPARRAPRESDEEDDLCEPPLSVDQLKALTRQHTVVPSPRVAVDSETIFIPNSSRSTQQMNEESDEDDDLCEPPLSVEQIEAMKKQQTVVAFPRAKVNNVSFFTPEIRNPFKKTEDESEEEDDLREPPLSLDQLEALKRQKRIVPPPRVAVNSETTLVLNSSKSTQQMDEESDESDDLCEPPLSVEQIEALKKQKTVVALPRAKENNVSFFTPEIREPSKKSDGDSDEEDNLCEPPLSVDQIEALKRQHRVVPHPRIAVDNETIFIPNSGKSTQQMSEESDEEDDLCEPPLSAEQIKALKKQQTVALPRVEENNVSFFTPEIREPSKKSEDESDEEDDLCEPPLSVDEIEALKRQQKAAAAAHPVKADNEAIRNLANNESVARSNEESDEEDDLCEPPLSFDRIEALKREQTVVAPHRVEVNSETFFVPKQNKVSGPDNENSEEEDDLCEPPLSVEQMEALKRQQKTVAPNVYNRAISAPKDNVSSEGIGEESDEDNYLCEDPWSFEQIEALRRSNRIGLPTRRDVDNTAFFTPDHSKVSQKADEESDEEDDLCEPPLSVEQIEALKRQHKVVTPPRVAVASETTSTFKSSQSTQQMNEESDEEDDLCEPPLSFEQIRALRQQQTVTSSSRVEFDSETIFVSRHNEFVNGHSKDEEEQDDLCETPLSFEQILRFKKQQRVAEARDVPGTRRVRFAPGNDEYIHHVYEISDEDSDLREQPDCELAPSNPINLETTVLTPDLLPLADLTQKEIDRIVARIPGGVANIQDIYALSPLQEGLLFHRFLNIEGDPCLLTAQKTYTDRSSLDRYLAAAQKVINRHDALRTGIIWNGLSTPVQVVRRRVPIICEELALSPKDGPIEDQLAELLSPVRYRMELSRAPLLRFVIAKNVVNGDWILRQIMHPLIGDRTSFEIIHKEIQAHLSGQTDQLPAPIPFRNLIARIKSDVDQEGHASFFAKMLTEIEDPTLPFGLGDLQQNNSHPTAATEILAPQLTRRLRDQSMRYGISVESLCHLAFAQLVSRTSQQEKVVFGTILSQRTQADWSEGSELGLFVNTLPLRIDVNDDSVGDCVGEVHERLAMLQEHSYASLASAQRCSNVPDRTPLFSALFSYRRSIFVESLGSEVPDTDPFRVTEYCNYPLTISVEDNDSTLHVTAKVTDPMDSKRLCAYLQQALESLVDALEARPDTPVRSLEILPEAERKMLLQAWNSLEPSYFEPPCAHELFEQQVEKTPDAIALVCREEKLTYAEVNRRANRLAHRMIELGVKPDGIVVICMSRTTAMVIGMLAILKAGGAYAPLDPIYPSGRLLYILDNVASIVVLADATGHAVLGKDCLEKCIVLDPNTTIEGPEENPKVPGLTSRNLIYVIHTSGSTGMPKGVMLEHRNLMWLLDALVPKFNFDHKDVWCLVHSFAFDFSVWETWGAFRCGGQLHILPHRGAFSSRELHEYVCNNNVTVLHQTCSAFKDYCKSYIENPMPDRLRYIIFAGEALESSILRLWYAARQGTSPQLVNLYGVTETSVFVTYKALNKRDAEQTLTPIGKCLPESSLYVLDDHRQLVPFGAVGELYVGGLAVARGYRNRPELNDERFVPDPFRESSGERMYKTGDLVRYLPNGDLVFVTRNDFQLKFRGFRMEPGEIENWLKTHPSVSDAVALTVGKKENNRLIAYVVADPVDNLEDKLRAYVAAELPSYMLPTDFVRLDEFPVSPNGKLDRSALPVPGDNTPGEEPYEEPRGPIERALEFVWKNLFNVERINRTDSFFALGGDSVMAVRMFSRLAGYGLDIPLSTLSTTTSLAGLAEIITARLEDPVFV